MHDLAKSSGVDLAVSPVQIIHAGTKNCDIGHLAADDADLRYSAAQETSHFFLQLSLNLFDEGRSLIIENVHLPQEPVPPVLRVAGSGIGDGKQLPQVGRGLLRRNQVDGLPLTSEGVFPGLFD